MRKLPVRPVTPPAYLRQARESNMPWNDFSKGPDGYALRQLKADVQAGLCGYCESMLVNDCGILPGSVAHIDHFYQKNRPGNEHLTYEWDNLVLSCMCEDSCGIHKDRQNIESKGIINPNREDARSMMTFIEVPRKGKNYRIEAREIEGPNRQKAQNTIEAFNLNCDRLSVTRYKRWLVFKQEVEEILTFALECLQENSREGQELFRPEMEKLLIEMEQGAFPSAMVALAREKFAPFLSAPA